MKYFKIISLSIMLLGIVFKLLHFPGNALLLLVGNLLFFIFSVFYFLKTNKEKKVKSYIFLIYSFIFVYVMFRLMYWPGGPLILGIRSIHLVSVVSSIIFMVFYLKEERKMNANIITFFIIFVLHLRLGYVQSHQLYYHTNLNPTFYPSSYDENYFSWDKYAWFLNLSNEKEKALNANLKAKSILIKQLNPSELETNETLQILKNRAFLIQIGSWNTYEPLYFY
jgi:hypothetical protein